MEVCYTNIKNKDFYLADKIISIHHNCICTNHSMGLTSNQYYIRTSINVKLDCFSNESKLYYGSMSSFGGNFFPHHEYTFVDFYNGEGGFVGKTSLNKPLWKGVGPRAQIVHGNRLFTRAGFGIEAKIQKMPKNTYMKMRFMPLWIDENGKLAENRVVAGYSCGADLTRGFSLNSYGEMNLGAKNGSTWSYGGIELAKTFGDLRLGYSVALNNKGDGKATPDLEHRIALRFNL